MPSFGKTIRKARLEKGYSLNQFAILAGISSAYLSLIERGLIKPPVDSKVKQIADLLGIHRDDLMYLAKRLPEDVQAIVDKDPESVARMIRKNIP